MTKPKYRPIVNMIPPYIYLLVESNGERMLLESRRIDEAPVTPDTSSIPEFEEVLLDKIEDSEEYEVEVPPLDDTGWPKEVDLTSSEYSWPFQPPNVKVSRLSYSVFRVDILCKDRGFTLQENLVVRKARGDEFIKPIAVPCLSPQTVKGLLNETVDLDPWLLINDICRHIVRFTKLKRPEYYTIAGLFPVLSVLREAFNSLGILYLNGPKGTGKSTTMEVVSSLCLNPIVSSSFTVPVLGYSIHTSQVTVAYDEAEELATGGKGDPKQRILRDSYRKNGARAFKTKNGIDQQCVYAPSIIANINPVNDPALNDRLIKLTTVRATEGDILERFDQRFEKETIDDISERLLLLLLLYGHAIADIYQEMKTIEGLDGRDFEIWAPYYALATFFDGYSGGRGRLLEDVRTMAKEHTRAKKKDSELLDEENRVITGAYLWTIARKKVFKDNYDWDYIHITPFKEYLAKEIGVKIGRTRLGKVLETTGIATFSNTRKRMMALTTMQRAGIASTCYQVNWSVLASLAQSLGIEDDPDWPPSGGPKPAKI